MYPVSVSTHHSFHVSITRLSWVAQ